MDLLVVATPISNALLRINDVQGKPPLPLEKTNEELDFWVLELASPAIDTAELWCVRVTRILKKHAPFLSTLRSNGSTLTLFVECAATGSVLRLEADFLKTLADLGVALEWAKD
ncbi:MAG: hypothetical protein RL693_587 [Verrucomicrobiota bacterium]